MDNVTQAAIDNTAQLEAIIQGINQLNTTILAILVIAGIVISFVIVQYVWRICFKPWLRWLYGQFQI